MVSEKKRAHKSANTLYSLLSLCFDSEVSRPEREDMYKTLVRLLVADRLPIYPALLLPESSLYNWMLHLLTEVTYKGVADSKSFKGCINYLAGLENLE